MKQAEIYYKNRFAGILREDDEGYTFEYTTEYIQSENAQPISLTMPLSTPKYQSKTMFPFFDGLIPEGWLLDIAVKNWKIDMNNRFEMLLKLCRDNIGCVSVIEKDA